jgi:hypothetical protein
MIGALSAVQVLFSARLVVASGQVDIIGLLSNISWKQS